MPSIIEGYNYDIFISYRQKDNKQDGWVTEFVHKLKGELESTFKEEVSVYFDINPHDGLLEIHDVDASLKEKLKCLVFIPIISRTYCDPSSFAWEKEFKAFVEQASKDRFGLKVRLPNGNVATRVLPVRIYDLDDADIKMCESVLGGVLRGIEFIYTEPGVNRPLRQRDDDVIHSTKQIIYRDQINKVANSIKEIISGLRAPGVSGEKIIQQKDPALEVNKEEQHEANKLPAASPVRRLLIGIIATAVLVIAAILAYPGLFRRDTMEKLRSSGERISVAVMPFQNLTNDTIWNVWQEAIQNELATSLTNARELKVRQTESVNSLIQQKGHFNYSSISPSIAGKISQKLEADIFIYGSIKQAGSTIRLNTQLIDTKSEEALKSYEIDGPAREDMIFRMTDSLKRLINNFLVISKLKTEMPGGEDLPELTRSPEAYRYFIYGNKSFGKRDYPTARNWYFQTLAADSGLYLAAIYLSTSFANQGLYEEAKKWCMWLYEKRDLMTLYYKIMTDRLYASFFDTPDEEIRYLKQTLELDDQQPVINFLLGYKYNELHQFDKAIPAFESALKIYNKRDSRPMWVYNYTSLGDVYHKTGQYKKEKKLYKKAVQDFPDDPVLIYNQAVLALTLEDAARANRYLDKYISVRRGNSATEADIMNGVAGIYADAGIPDKAEKYYRDALSLEPENPTRLNNLAWFLIDNNININEGLELIEKALVQSPDIDYMIDTKGWGLYKQGRYREALEILEKSWEVKSVYDHEIFLHLEAARKAVAGKKNSL
ncbi:MAG: hypothetical protein JXN62_02115 [Bacteroidales bacterium]|nr:hypothetical protein [Bacteroidales bacterium]